MNTPLVPAQLPRMLGALRERGDVPRSVREEIRSNLEERLRSGQPLSSAVMGY